jgi:hypothetical protein
MSRPNSPPLQFQSHRLSSSLDASVEDLRRIGTERASPGLTDTPRGMITIEAGDRGQRRRSTLEFKRHALLLNANQQLTAKIAGELGIPRNRIRNGRRKGPRLRDIPRLRSASRTRSRIGSAQVRVGLGEGGAGHVKKVSAGLRIISALWRQRDRCQTPVEAVKLFCREIFIL